MQLFCLQLEASCLQWSFLTYSRVWKLVTLQPKFLYLHLKLLYLQALFVYLQLKLSCLHKPYSGKVRLVSTLTDCKQRSSTVGRKGPTASEKASPIIFCDFPSFPCPPLRKGTQYRAVLKDTCQLKWHWILVAHDCGYPLSRYTCRTPRVAAAFLDLKAFCRCSTGVALHPLNILVSYLPPPFPGGVAPKFGSEKVSRYTGVSQLQLRVSRYTVQLSTGCKRRLPANLL